MDAADQAWQAERQRRGGASAGPKKGFGRDAIWSEGAILAFRMDDAIIVKCGPEAVAEAVASGLGEPFRNGRGSPMKAWAAFPITEVSVWRAAIASALKEV